MFTISKNSDHSFFLIDRRLQVLANLEQLARNLATKISQSNDSKIEAAKTATINQVKTEVVETAIKENLNVSNMDALATDEEVENILKGYVKTSDIFKNGYFYSKKDTDNGSYALIFNESDGGGSQYLNSSKDILSYVGTNDGDENGICVQIYSKFKGETSNNIPNKGVRINVNPNGAFYTKGTNTSANGGVENNSREIAVKADIPDLTDYVTSSIFNSSFARLWQNFNVNDDSQGQFYTKKTNADNSYALLFNESDGGGSQYYNKEQDIISYVGTNDGDSNGVCVQIYSKFKDGTLGNAVNSGVRINVNPNGAFYTKGTNTSATGGSATNEIAVKGDVETLQSRIIVLESLVHALQLALANAVDANGNSVYTVPNQ